MKQNNTLCYSEEISQTRLILMLDTIVKYVRFPFFFWSSNLSGSRFFDPGEFGEIHWTVVRILHDTLVHRYATYTSKGGSSEFSRWADHLFSSTTLLSDRKFGHCRNSASDRSKEISPIKGSCRTLHICAGRAEKVFSVDHISVDNRWHTFALLLIKSSRK